jgi:hypothetical protein
MIRLAKYLIVFVIILNLVFALHLSYLFILNGDFTSLLVATINYFAAIFVYLVFLYND